GRRRTFQTGLAAFTLGSLLCSLAPGLGWLVAFRMLQAIGGAVEEPGGGVGLTKTVLWPRAGGGGARARGRGGGVDQAGGRGGGDRGGAGRGGGGAGGGGGGRGGLLGGDPPGGAGRAAAARVVRPGAARAARPPVRPGWAGPGHRGAGRPGLRDHRGAGGR